MQLPSLLLRVAVVVVAQRTGWCNRRHCWCVLRLLPSRRGPGGMIAIIAGAHHRYHRCAEDRDVRSLSSLVRIAVIAVARRTGWCNCRHRCCASRSLPLQGGSGGAIAIITAAHLDCRRRAENRAVKSPSSLLRIAIVAVADDFVYLNNGVPPPLHFQLQRQGCASLAPESMSFFLKWRHSTERSAFPRISHQ